MNIKVKSLVWDKHPDKQEWYATLPELDGATAESGYMVIANKKGSFTLYLGFGTLRRVMGYRTLETDAKDDAQEHHEARILSAIDVDATEAAIRADERAKVIGELTGLEESYDIGLGWSDQAVASKDIDALHTPESRAIAEAEA